MHIERGRVGQFFLFLGIFLLAIFFSTDPGVDPVIGFFLSGAGLVLFGLYLIRRAWKPPTTSNRFRLLRRLRRRDKDKQYD